MDIVNLVKEFGPWAMLVAYLVWQGWKREQRMARRLDHVEDSIREQLVKVIERNTSTMNLVLSSLRSRPCLHDHQPEPQAQSIPPELRPTDAIVRRNQMHG